MQLGGYVQTRAFDFHKPKNTRQILPNAFATRILPVACVCLPAKCPSAHSKLAPLAQILLRK